MFKDWCPLCGRRFQGKTPNEVCNQILEHNKEGNNGEISECEKNFRPLEEVLKDSQY